MEYNIQARTSGRSLAMSSRLFLAIASRKLILSILVLSFIFSTPQVW